MRKQERVRIHLTKRQREVLEAMAYSSKDMRLLSIFDGRLYGIVWRLKTKGYVGIADHVASITAAGRKALEEGR